MPTIDTTMPSLSTPSPTPSTTASNIIDHSAQESDAGSGATSDESADYDEYPTWSDDEVNNEVDDEEEDDGPRFTFFNQLPLEIRRKIWKNACSITRLVDLWAVSVYTTNAAEWFSDNFGSDGPFVFKSRSRPPAVLHASMEARKIGLESYSLEFGKEVEKQINGATFRVSIPNTIYVNWQSDIICPMPTNYRTGDRHEPFTSKHWSQTLNDFMNGNIPYKYNPRFRKTQRLALAYDNLGSIDWNEWLLPSCQISEIVLYSSTIGPHYLAFHTIAQIELSEASVDEDDAEAWKLTYVNEEREKLQVAQLELQERLQRLVEEHNFSTNGEQEGKGVDSLTPPAVKFALLDIDLL